MQDFQIQISTTPDKIVLVTSNILESRPWKYNAYHSHIYSHDLFGGSRLYFSLPQFFQQNFLQVFLDGKMVSRYKINWLVSVLTFSFFFFKLKRWGERHCHLIWVRIKTMKYNNSVWCKDKIRVLESDTSGFLSSLYHLETAMSIIEKPNWTTFTWKLFSSHFFNYSKNYRTFLESVFPNRVVTLQKTSVININKLR